MAHEGSMEGSEIDHHIEREAATALKQAHAAKEAPRLVMMGHFCCAHQERKDGTCHIIRNSSDLQQAITDGLLPVALKDVLPFDKQQTYVIVYKDRSHGHWTVGNTVPLDHTGTVGIVGIELQLWSTAGAGGFAVTTGEGLCFVVEGDAAAVKHVKVTTGMPQVVARGAETEAMWASMGGMLLPFQHVPLAG
jgi:hypothetical protein